MTVNSGILSKPDQKCCAGVAIATTILWNQINFVAGLIIWKLNIETAANSCRRAGFYVLNHDKGLFTITSGSMTGFFFLKKEEVSSSLLHCVACGCSMKLNIFMVILEREKKI